MMPPVGKSGPRTIRERASVVASGLSIKWIMPLQTSRRLCGGILVAMPTAIPADRHPVSQNSLALIPGDSAWTRVVPYVQASHKRQHHHEGDSFSKLHPRYLRIYEIAW